MQCYYNVFQTHDDIYSRLPIVSVFIRHYKHISCHDDMNGKFPTEHYIDQAIKTEIKRTKKCNANRPSAVCVIKY